MHIDLKFLVKSKLDRGFCSQICLDFWCNIDCKILTRHQYDHAPLWMCFVKTLSLGPHPFHFQSMWISHGNFHYVVAQVWVGHFDGNLCLRVMKKLGCQGCF